VNLGSEVDANTSPFSDSVLALSDKTFLSSIVTK
jgi:hypothetical protein